MHFYIPKAWREGAAAWGVLGAAGGGDPMDPMDAFQWNSQLECDPSQGWHLCPLLLRVSQGARGTPEYFLAALVMPRKCHHLLPSVSAMLSSLLSGSAAPDSCSHSLSALQAL